MNEKVAIKQTKFSNGEISASLYGDVLHPKWAASLRTCLNWLPIPQGALVKRSGTAYKAPVKDITYVPRLIPFFFSDNQTFVLEVGNLYIRYYQNGKYVGNDGKLHTYGDAYVGGYYETATTITTAMLPYLKYSQVGDVITFTYGGQAGELLPPQDLKHTGSALIPWTISATPLKIPAGVVTWVTGPLDGVGGFTYTGAGTGQIWNKGERAVWLDGALVTTEWICIQDNTKGSNQKPPDPATLNSTSVQLAGSLFWMPSVDTAHPAVKSAFAQTAVVQDANGVVYESAPSPVLNLNGSLASDRQRPLRLETPAIAAGYTLLYTKLYRGSPGGVLGWVNDITTANLVAYPANAGTNLCYLDDGKSPDFTKQPPQGTDPFLVRGVDSYPSIIGYLDQRRLWAASALLPTSMFFSKVGDLYNYDNRNTPGADTDAMNLLLSSEVLEQIRAFVPMRRGIVLTAQGEWAISGAGGGPISRSNSDAKRQSRWGSNWLNPIVIGTGLLFNTAKSNMVRDLYPLYGLYADIWDGQDLTVLSRDLFNLHTIKDWAFQSVPYPIVWAVRDDGVLLSLTYQHSPPSFGQQLAEGIVAWARHVTGIGSDTFEAVCTVPEPPEDAVYVVVRRLINGVYQRYIERFANLTCPASPYVAGVSDLRYGVYLDAAVAYDGHNDQLNLGGNIASMDSVAVPGSLDPANYGIGSQIKIALNSTPFVASDAASQYGSAFIFDPENAFGFGVIKCRIVGFTDTSHVIAELDTACTQAQVNNWAVGYNGSTFQNVTKWAIAKAQISASHLNGYALDSGDANLSRGLLCLADGDVQIPAAWINGVAYLQTPAVVIQLGVAYNSDVVTLDAFHAQAEIRNRFKNVVRIGFEVAGSRDMWMGKDLQNLQNWKMRQVGDAYNVLGLQTGYYEVGVTGQFNKSGQVALRHYQPLPATITSILREIDLGNS